MAEIQSTPGPWFIEDGQIFSNYDGQVAAGNVIATVSFEPDSGGEDDPGYNAVLKAIWAEQHANATLLAAAPTMFAALKRQVERLEAQKPKHFSTVRDWVEDGLRHPHGTSYSDDAYAILQILDAVAEASGAHIKSSDGS